MLAKVGNHLLGKWHNESLFSATSHNLIILYMVILFIENILRNYILQTYSKVYNKKRKNEWKKVMKFGHNINLTQIGILQAKGDQYITFISSKAR